MGENGSELITATGVDPDVLDALIGGAKKNRSAQSKKQVYDAQRIRVRVDVTEPVRDLLADEAKRMGTSVNDFAKFLLVHALALYFEEDEGLHELLDFQPSRSIRKDVEIVLDGVMARLQKAIAKAAETLPSADTTPANGATDGADEWGGWLDQ